MRFEVLFTKVLKKIHFSEIHLKNLVGFRRFQADFWAVIQDMLKMTVLPFSQHHSRKSQELLGP